MPPVRGRAYFTPQRLARHGAGPWARLLAFAGQGLCHEAADPHGPEALKRALGGILVLMP